MKIALALAFSLAAVAVAGCVSFDELGGPDGRAGRVCGPDVETRPCAAGVTVGKAYPFQLLTHCGVKDAYFDGRRWIAKPPLTNGSGSPPPNWDYAITQGTMTLVSRRVAEFRADSGETARFVAAPAGYRPETCA